MSAKPKSVPSKAETKPAEAKPVTPRPVDRQGAEDVQDDRLTEWFNDVFLPQYGKQAGMVLGAAALLLIAWFAWRGFDAKSQHTANRKLGQAFVYLSQDRNDSAAAALLDVLQEGPGGVAEAKANLLLGKVRYNQGRYDDAIKAYSAVDVSSRKLPLLASGALHGLASSYMEKKDFAKAAATLEQFVHDFGRRSGNPEEKLAGQEVVDPTPAMPNALWKLTLCYRELKDMAKAKATAEKLSRIYPETREGGDALRLLAQL